VPHILAAHVCMCMHMYMSAHVEPLLAPTPRLRVPQAEHRYFKYARARTLYAWRSRRRDRNYKRAHMRAPMPPRLFAFRPCLHRFARWTLRAVRSPGDTLRSAGTSPQERVDLGRSRSFGRENQGKMRRLLAQPRYLDDAFYHESPR
jgi:hypothetical protein